MSAVMDPDHHATQSLFSAGRNRFVLWTNVVPSFIITRMSCTHMVREAKISKRQFLLTCISTDIYLLAPNLRWACRLYRPQTPLRKWAHVALISRAATMCVHTE
jgi:hypothetical protein